MIKFISSMMTKVLYLWNNEHKLLMVSYILINLKELGGRRIMFKW